MSTYIHFTDEQKQRAASVDLEEFLRCRGEKLLTSGREKRLARDHSVTIRGNEWYDHAEERGGHAVSFVQRFYHLSYPEAVTMLLGGEMGTVYPSAQERVEEPPKPFVLPPANSNMRRVYAYLVRHRNIDRSVVAHFAKEKLLYEDAEYHNAVFVGTDEDGIPRHAHKRSANSYGKAFRLNVEGCDPRHSFHHIGRDESLYVFEAPIDMLSYITLHPEDWQSHSYVACCGTSIQPVLKLLERQPQINTVLLCLDNDEAGHLASRRMKEQLAESYTVERLIPEHKDWNDDLTAEELKGVNHATPSPDFVGRRRADVSGHRLSGRLVSLLHPERDQIQNGRRRPARHCKMGHSQRDSADLCPCPLRGQEMAQRPEPARRAGAGAGVQG